MSEQVTRFSFLMIERPAWGHNVPGVWFSVKIPLENNLGVFDGIMFWPDNCMSAEGAILYDQNGIQVNLTDMDDFDESYWTLPQVY